MAIAVQEAIESRSQRDGTNPSAELVYFVTGTDDELAAKAAVKASLTTYGGLWPNEVSIEPHAWGTDGLRMFRAVVTYGPTPGGISVGDDEDTPPTFSAEFSTESTKIQQALASLPRKFASTVSRSTARSVNARRSCGGSQCRPMSKG
jgi:hypothetical protein